MKILALLAILAILAAAGIGVTLYKRTSEPFKAYEAAEQFVTIEPGSSTRTIGQTLIASGVVRDDLTLRAALWRTGVARSLKAGEYRFDRPMTTTEVVEKIGRGDVYERRVTFPEGLTFADATPIHNVDPDARDLEGYLFPETYSLRRDSTAPMLVHTMVARFEQLFTTDMQQAAEPHGLTPRQVVTLASLVENETAVDAERPIVAAVYLNRLKIGMGMQCDPTVIYALQKAGRYNGNLTRENLQFDSPYNTYRYAGLPPGPIANPGLASLKAAVAPAEVDYLYFVSRNDGSHVFARTLDEHNQNVRKFQVEYFRQQRAR
ncbi:MAG: endolytic transglycosylase MltG [Betaproteobacteria bacterium]